MLMVFYFNSYIICKWQYKKKKPIQICFSNKPYSKRNLLEPLNFDFRFYNSFSRFTYEKHLRLMPTTI